MALYLSPSGSLEKFRYLLKIKIFIICFENKKKTGESKSDCVCGIGSGERAEGNELRLKSSGERAQVHENLSGQPELRHTTNTC